MNCILCQAAIPAERLEAMPETRVCVGCSAKVGGEFYLRSTPVVTSKGGSMKRNYGGVEVERVRKPLSELKRRSNS